jgi:GxxExxY protein
LARKLCHRKRLTAKDTRDARDEVRRDSFVDGTAPVIDAAMKVHTRLGPGLLESAYKACLAHELRKRGHTVITELAIPVVYEGLKLDVGYRADLCVDGRILTELKTVKKIAPIHEAQIISNLKLSGYRIGLLINFHVRHLKDGISRFVNDY